MLQTAFKTLNRETDKAVRKIKNLPSIEEVQTFGENI